MRVGDIVVLNSGGPKMTVAEVGDDSQVSGVWYDDKNRLESRVFPSMCIYTIHNKESMTDRLKKEYP